MKKDKLRVNQNPKTKSDVDLFTITFVGTENQVENLKALINWGDYDLPQLLEVLRLEIDESIKEI
tara:strand:- start:13517 stop:13711 length:195 start_codon:yes stop_codon:yes gene_type:complete